MPEPEPSLPPKRAELKLKRPVGDAAPNRRTATAIALAAPAFPLPPKAEHSAGLALLRAALWIGLVGWLLVLAFKLLDPLPFLFPDEDDTATYSWWRVDPTRVAAEVDQPDAIAKATPEDPELYALKLQIAEALLAGRFPDAIAVIERQQQADDIYPYQSELADLATFVRDVSRANQIVADAIRDRIDEEIVIRVKDRRITIIPRASAGDRINALLIPPRADQPRRSATFSVSDLDPIERAHWIGQADTPRKCTMKLLLHLQAGDEDGARVFAPSCGPLASAFEARMKTATRGTTGP
ncbi:MAG: hypothetical protein HQ523_10135 [Lentisphaerae bacterium]|nr:hypothetical protein [Lentisphaerota bacterium]